MMKRRLLPLLALAVPGAAFASPIWSSNFESGSLSDWTSIQQVSPDRTQIVSDPVKEGTRALKVTVNQGDDPVNCGNDRAELLYMTQEAPGSEYWYHWNVLFPADYPSSDKWQLFTQWHQNGLAGSPPVEIYVVGDEMRLRTGGNEGPVIWKAPLERGQWQDFVLHVKWSSDPTVGFVELYRNGKLELQKTPAQTQLPGDVNYLKMGLYRARAIAPTASIYFDDVKMGTTQADVMPAQPATAQQTSAQQTSGSPAQTGGASTAGVPAPTDNPASGAGAQFASDVPPGTPQAAGCAAGGQTALPIAAALGLLGLTSVLRRRRATVTVPARDERK